MSLIQSGDENALMRHDLGGSRAATPIATVAQLGVGAFLLAGTALAGLIFVHRPWPNRLDAWGFRLLPANPTARWAHALVNLGSPTALLVGGVIVFVVGIFVDRVRAIAAAAGPVLAVLIVQDVAKPLVDRPSVLSGGLSYPSGTVAAVAALATSFTLVMSARRRVPAAMLGLLAIVGTGAAVVVLRWHYPTDALGGASVGMGSVLLVDALLHAPGVLMGLLDRRLVAGVNVSSHAQVHHHGNPGEREGYPGQVAGR